MPFLQPPTEWDGGVGFVTKDMIEKHCPPPAADVQVCTFQHVLSKIPLNYMGLPHILCATVIARRPQQCLFFICIGAHLTTEVYCVVSIFDCKVQLTTSVT